MVNFFVGEIQIGRITVEAVPSLWRKKVQAKITELTEKESAEEAEK
ncbi:hypothetical protein [Enterococcus timonensis]|nr:hypothetical protein [Enterococcus timonensis]